MSVRPDIGGKEPVGYWKAVFLLLGAARKRAAGRQKRQQELMQQRNNASTMNWGGLLAFLAFVVLLGLHGASGYILREAVKAGQKVEAERTEKIVVDSWFKTSVDERLEDEAKNRQRAGGTTLETFAGKVDIVRPARHEREISFEREARSLSRQYGGDAGVIESRLRATVDRSGGRDLLDENAVIRGVTELGGMHSVSAMLGSIVLGWWALMLVLQGEGLELDLQRRRHPMWEWLFAHPVSAGAIFTAEILSPLAANPIYWSAPAFIGVLYWQVYDFGQGAIAVVVAGIPIAIAAACMGKALEIGCILRFSPRSRGALIGLMSWFGYASMVLLFLSVTSIDTIAGRIGGFLAPLTALPWPWLGWFLGQRPDGSFSFVLGMLVCLASACAVGGAAVRFCIWGAKQGLGGNTGGEASGPVAKAADSRGTRFGKEPLYRKEMLWFLRDRSAIVQTILIPLTVASVQLFNLRRAMEMAQGTWNYLSGAAILLGTYFLWILGPKSLASEGAALWISLTWPRGLESLLKAKAWLWSLISTGIVALVLGYAVYLYPADAWKIGLVGVGWYIFGRSMAEKTVTLVPVTSSSGEPEPISRGRRWAASLGMLTFAIGIISQQWSVAVVGIVYSYLTAAAMWENFRARLPYLYDPWSEKLPPPPTLMHAMVAVSILVECAAIATGIAVALGGRDSLGVVRSMAYAGSALLVSFGVANFLRAREVRLSDVVCWRGQNEAKPEGAASRWWCGDGSYRSAFARAMALGLGGGLALGVIARGYLALLMHIPEAAEMLRQTQELLLKYPDLRISYTFCAVVVAPFVEEYLFRGLLFRALDREWGGWRAVVGSAAFFAIYHPPLAWLPVGLVGAANALIFKKTGRLAPAVILHMAYNAVVSL